jgi:invasion protein IalB
MLRFFAAGNPRDDSMPPIVRNILTVTISLALTVLLVTASGAATPNIWYKLCTKSALTASSANIEAGGVCQTMADVRDNKTAVLIGRVAIRELPGQASYQLEVLLPPGSALPPGALVKIDGGEPIKLAYKRCDASGCYAHAAAGNLVIMQMRSGKQIAYLSVDVRGKALNIPLPLAGFAEAFEGTPKALDKYRADEKKIAEVIAKRLAEAGKAPPAVTPASSQAFANMGKNPVINTGWYKLCQDVKTLDSKVVAVCLTQVDIRVEDSMVLAGKIAARKIAGQASWQMLVMLPLGTSLSEGATVTIDQGEPIKLTFTTCDASQCYAHADISNAILDRLKSGHEVSYTGTDESGDTLQVPVSLSGFKEALDGPAMPVDAYNAEMKKIAETILIRAARRRKEQHR